MEHVQIGLQHDEIPMVVLVVSDDASSERLQLGMTALQARQVAVALLTYADKLDPPV